MNRGMDAVCVCLYLGFLRVSLPFSPPSVCYFIAYSACLVDGLGIADLHLRLHRLQFWLLMLTYK